MERIRRIVQANLHLPTFGPKRLCRLAGMSRSHLYRLFEPSGGVARYIQGQRLMAAHAVLADLEQRAPIAAIAETFGFCDASTFSRAFRAEFGYRPSDVRMAGLGGTAAPARPRAAAPDPNDLSSLLRHLQR
jgi:AraC-like DNA-binding protein